MLTVVVMALVFSFASCANLSRNSAYSQDKTITLAEFRGWAGGVASSVLTAPTLASYPSPVTVAIGDFTNSSSRMEVGKNKDVFLNELQRKLTNSGRMQVTRLYAGTGGRTDSITRQSRELGGDPSFRSGSAAGFDGQAEAARLVLSLQFVQQRTVDRNGRNIYENFFHVELIDQVSKAVVFSDDVDLTKDDY